MTQFFGAVLFLISALLVGSTNHIEFLSSMASDRQAASPPHASRRALLAALWENFERVESGDDRQYLPGSFVTTFDANLQVGSPSAVLWDSPVSRTSPMAVSFAVLLILYQQPPCFCVHSLCSRRKWLSKGLAASAPNGASSALKNGYSRASS